MLQKWQCFSHYLCRSYFNKDIWQKYEVAESELCHIYFVFALESYQSPRPLSLRLFLVSLVMSGAAGQCVRLMLPSEDPDPAPALSCEKAFSSREGVKLSLGSESTPPPTGPSLLPSSSGKRLGQKIYCQFSSWCGTQNFLNFYFLINIQQYL